jgi:hypothetical protein
LMKRDNPAKPGHPLAGLPHGTRLSYVRSFTTAPNPYVRASSAAEMPKTNAEYQREHRQRRARRLAALEAQCAVLEAERDRLRADLDAMQAECERLAAMACRHPAGAVDGGTCRACGAEVW